jgi:hypothetical protein
MVYVLENIDENAVEVRKSSVEYHETCKKLKAEVQKKILEVRKEDMPISYSGHNTLEVAKVT